jgi:hypothetical protein
MWLLIVGLLLAGGAGAFTGLVIAYNTAGGPKYTAEMFGHTLPTLNTLGVFCAGVALGTIFCLGLWLLVTGARHTMRRPTHARPARPVTPDNDLGAGHPQPS